MIEVAAALLKVMSLSKDTELIEWCKDWHEGDEYAKERAAARLASTYTENTLPKQEDTYGR